MVLPLHHVQNSQKSNASILNFYFLFIKYFLKLFQIERDQIDEEDGREENMVPSAFKKRINKQDKKFSSQAKWAQPFFLSNPRL